MMRVAAYPADDGGVGRYRIRWPGQALADQGADIVIHPAGDLPRGLFRDTTNLATGTTTTVLADVEHPDADIVVLQRPTHRSIIEAIPLLQAHGVRVVIEVDDDLTALHPRNDSYRALHPTLSPARNFRHLRRACQLADHVVVTTPALAARFARHGRYTIVPNHIPAAYLNTVRRPHDGTWVGWAGNMIVHPTDPQVTGGAVATAVTDTAARFMLIGAPTGVLQAFRLPKPPELVTDECRWLRCPEPREVELDGRRGLAVTTPGQVVIEDYPHAVAQLDVGVVPLADIAFNQAKSALKLTEMSAVGVPAVVSPTADNVRAAKLGMGVLAGRPREWRREVTRLVTDEHWRTEVAGRARAAATAWTIEGNCERWWDAWTAPLRTRRAA